jgi:signal transduction histidine kinase
MTQGVKKQSAGKNPKEELVNRLVEFVNKTSEGSREQQKNREEIQVRLKEWEKDLRHLLETSNRLSDVNAESAELLAELEIRNQSLGELNRKLAEANASSVNMMVEIEEKNNILAQTNKELARANAHAAELMAIIETKEEHIQELNKSLSKANARSADLVADLELRMVEIKELNSTLTKEIEVREKVEDELRESNATKDRFFSIIAHDLRNPFISIGNFITLMNKHSAVLSKTEIIAISKELKESTDKTQELLENLLQWAQSQRGTIHFKPEVIELSEISEEITSLFGPIAKAKSITLESHIKNNTLAFADWQMTSTILRNLVSNAIKFTPENGTVSVKAIQTEELLQIKVSDTGIGMKQEVMDKLFIVGQKVVSTGTANEKGTGLGLLLCKELVEKNGGYIDVYSEPEKGSTFSFTLPKTPAEKKP